MFGGLPEREQTIGLLERGTVVTRYSYGNLPGVSILYSIPFFPGVDYRVSSVLLIFKYFFISTRGEGGVLTHLRKPGV